MIGQRGLSGAPNLVSWLQFAGFKPETPNPGTAERVTKPIYTLSTVVYQFEPASCIRAASGYDRAGPNKRIDPFHV
jgi:hypothetical protein